MKLQDLINDVNNGKLNPNAELVFSKVMVLNDEEELVAVVDIPIFGIASNEDDNEIRFCIRPQLGDDQEQMLKDYFGDVVISFIDKESTE